MRRGFTLIEMLVVVVLFAIVGAFGGRLFQQAVRAVSIERESADAYLARQAVVRQMREDVWHARSVEAGKRLTLQVGEESIAYEFVAGKIIRHAEDERTYVLAAPSAPAIESGAVARASVDRGIVTIEFPDEQKVTLFSPVAGGVR